MKITTLTLLAIMAMSSALSAVEVALPVIASPSLVREGTQRELTLSQVTELLPWAKNSKGLLIDVLGSIDGLSTQDKIDRLTQTIEQTVLESAPKNSELFMRYTLNRAIVVNETLNKEMNDLNVGTSDVKLRVLIESIKLAIKYYDVDLNTLQTKKGNTSFVQYGVDYYTFLTELNKSIVDASAQYNIQKMSLEFLQWDLYRDLNNASYASTIVKINNNLKFYPSTKISDAQSLNYIRQMKKLALSLDLKSATPSTAVVAPPAPANTNYVGYKGHVETSHPIFDINSVCSKGKASYNRKFTVVDASIYSQYADKWGFRYEGVKVKFNDEPTCIGIVDRKKVVILDPNGLRL